ncbi:MAG: hypothetical protein LBF66_01905 [Holosporales bacterium]|nr:hypothetical protein [Holosporales bacterium]
MNVKKMLLASALLLPMVAESVSVSGFFVGVRGSAAYTGVKSYFRKEGDKAANDVEFSEANGFGVPFGATVGGGFEANGFYVGAEIYGGIFIRTLSTDSTKKKGTVSLALGSATSASSYESFVSQTFKLKGFYGGSIQVGGKISQSCVLYASFGVEGTYLTPNSQILIVAKNTTSADVDKTPIVGFAINVGTDTTYSDTDEILKSLVSVTDYVTGTAKLTPTKVDAKGTSLVSFSPGVGVMWAVGGGVAIRFQADAQFGIKQKVDSAYLDKGAAHAWQTKAAGAVDATNNSITLSSAKAQKMEVYNKIPLGFRFGAGFVYHF